MGFQIICRQPVFRKGNKTPGSFFDIGIAVKQSRSCFVNPVGIQPLYKIELRVKPAWFVANEFHSNGDNVYRLLKKNEKIVDHMRKIYNDPLLRENFEKLIRINVSMIMERNMLRL